MRPYFVIGPPRSGTTLIHDLLDLHPAVSAHSESFHTFHHNLLRFRHRTDPEEQFRLTTSDAGPALAEEYRNAMHAAAGDCDVFLLKISTLSIQVDFVRALVPEARFIQLVRDARDAACSMEDLRRTLEAEQGHERLLGPAPDPFGLWCAERWHNKHLRAAASWYYHVTRSMLDLGFAGGDACLRLRYEDFLAEPRATAERVLAFLGLDVPAGLQEALRQVSAIPAEPGGIGFSTCQAPGQRIGRYRDELDPRLRHTVAPLLETPMLLLGYSPDPPGSCEQFAASCAGLGVDAGEWRERVEREIAWFSLHRRVFSPESMLRQTDYPTPHSRPLLVDGAMVGHRAFVGDGAGQGGVSWVQKQNRRHDFHDPDRTLLAVADRLDGNHTVAELGLDAAACTVLEQLAGQGFVGYA
jgi:hypothetical protein